MRLINADEFERRMYDEAFEKDSEDQRWDSGCWIRYRLFEKILREQPTIEPELKKGSWIYDHGDVKCSVCGHTIDDPYYVEDYCTKCGSFNGAKIEKKQKHLGNNSDLVFLDEVTHNLEDEKMSDLIERQAVIDEIEYELEMINSALNSTTLDFNTRQRLYQRRGEAREIFNSIQQLPPAQPDREVGKWIKVMEGNAYRDKCSRCSETYPNAYGYNFCPNCGRKMEEK